MPIEAYGIMYVLFPATAIVGGFTAYVTAENRYHSGLWFVFGFFFNIFGMIAAAGLPDKKGWLGAK